MDTAVKPAIEAARRRITHLVCRRTSYNPNDVEHRYCGFCQQYLKPGDYVIEVKGQIEWTVQVTR